MFFAFLLLYLRLPVLKINMTSSRIYIVNEIPGNRRDVAVPRPYRCAGMAVVAGALQHRLNLPGDLHVCFEAAGWSHRWVRPARLNGLNEDQNRNRADDNPFCLDTSHRRASPKSFE